VVERGGFADLSGPAFSHGSGSAGADATGKWKRDPGASHRRCSPSRARQYRQPDGSDDLWEHRDDVLCRRRLFWGGRDKTDATRNPGGFAGRSHGGGRLGDRLPGGVVKKEVTSLQSYIVTS